MRALRPPPLAHTHTMNQEFILDITIKLKMKVKNWKIFLLMNIVACILMTTFESLLMWIAFSSGKVLLTWNSWSRLGEIGHTAWVGEIHRCRGVFSFRIFEIVVNRTRLSIWLISSALLRAVSRNRPCVHDVMSILTVLLQHIIILAGISSRHFWRRISISRNMVLSLLWLFHVDVLTWYLMIIICRMVVSVMILNIVRMEAWAAIFRRRAIAWISTIGTEIDWKWLQA